MKGGTYPPIDEQELARIRAEAMDFANIGLYRYRFDGTIVFIDRGTLRLLDLEEYCEDPSTLIGKNIGSLLEYIDPPGRLREAMRNQKSLRDFEYRFRTLSGRVQWVYHNSYIVTDPNTGEEQIQAIVRDISVLKEAAHALEASERRYRALAEQSLQGIGVFRGEDRRLIFANPALSDLLGESRTDLLGVTVEWILARTVADDRPAMREAIDRTFLGRVVEQVNDIRIVRQDGQLIWVTPVFVPIEYDGRPAVQVTIADSTERLMEEERRRVLENRMRHAQKLESLGVLAGGIAHDFNNLLAGVLGNADLAARRLGSDEAVKSHLSEIRKASRRASDLCRQLLAYSGRGRVTSESLLVNHLIQETGELLKVSVSKKAELVYRLESNLPAARGDPSQLRQVLMNLIVNASEAIGDEPGTITLVTRLERFRRSELDSAYGGRERSEGPYIVLEVNDDGVGMDPETLDRIFEPFFTTKFTGRGLGLAAVLGIIRGHEGALFVNSQKGHGTQFRVLLPPADELLQVETPKANDSGFWHGQGTVLIVDDEEPVRLTAREMLRELGFESLEAANGREATQIFVSHRDSVSFVLLDVLMPQSDGRQCFEEIRRSNPDVPVVFSSGYGEDFVSDLVEHYARVHFLQKPYDLKRMTHVLREAIGQIERP